MGRKVGRGSFHMSKTSAPPVSNAIGRARGPRGFGGPVEKAKDKKGTLKRSGDIWRNKK